MLTQDKEAEEILTLVSNRYPTPVLTCLQHNTSADMSPTQHQCWHVSNTTPVLTCLQHNTSADMPPTQHQCWHVCNTTPVLTCLQHNPVLTCQKADMPPFVWWTAGATLSYSAGRKTSLDCSFNCDIPLTLITIIRRELKL